MTHAAFTHPLRSSRRKMSANTPMNIQMTMNRKNPMIIHQTTSQKLTSSSNSPNIMPPLHE